MSEKPYAYLLRLFPSAFRQRYEDEALQLLRDRLAYERGIFRRVRLCFDLMTDILRSLPQAYKNSYAVTPEASIAVRVNNAPSFRALQKEPLRREALALAGVASLAALSAFSFLMTRPVSYRTDVRNRHISPIESVIERLNEPVVPVAAESARRGATQAAQSIADPAKGGFPLERGLPQSGKRVAGDRTRAELPDAKNGEAKLTSRIPTQGVVVPIPAAQASIPSVQVVAAGPSSLHVADARTLAAELNLSRKWIVSIDPTNAVADAPRWIDLRQANGRLKGMGGPDSAGEYPIVNGQIAGGSVRFELNYGKRRYLYDLRSEGDMLQGTLSIAGGNRVKKSRVWLMPAN